MAEVQYEDRMRTRPPSGNVVAPTKGLRPERKVLHGDYCTLEPLDPARHASDLFAASHGLPDQIRIWDYLPAGPFPNFPSFNQWIIECAASADPLFYAIRDKKTGRTTGMASYLNIHPGPGSIEIGHIMFGSPLQKTPAATEALYLLMDYAMTRFELSTTRMEVQRAQQSVAQGRKPAGIPLRRNLLSAFHREGTQSRYRLVFDSGWRMAPAARKLRAMAFGGQFR